MGMAITYMEEDSMNIPMMRKIRLKISSMTVGLSVSPSMAFIQVWGKFS